MRLLQDLPYSVRQLGKIPGFTFTAVVSWALGIGATTAVFSVIYATLVNPYPFAAADRIMRLTALNKAGKLELVEFKSGPDPAPAPGATDRKRARDGVSRRALRSE